MSQKVELVDVNNDGWVDIVFANSSGTDTGGGQNAQPNQLLINNGGTGFTEQGGVFEDPDNAYVIKAGDLDNDGDADLVVGDNYQGQSYVLLNEGAGDFTRQDIAAGASKSIGDLELGDVDGDGDLDIVATDWGNSQPFGDPVDEGLPLLLWLGNGDGTFEDGSANLPMGMEAWAAYSFDIELVDLDNNYVLDVLVSSRGLGFGFGLQNDGSGNFSKLTVPALEGSGKQVNVAFTPNDFDGDGAIDIITLQDGVGGAGNSVLINNGIGNYPSDPGTFWPNAYNPDRLDFDAATLDFNNDGRPDFVVTGLGLGPNDKNSRLFLNNNGMEVKPPPEPLDAAFPAVSGLGQSFGLQFADFNHDRRADVAIAQRDAALPNFVLFGRDDPADSVPVDTVAPRIYEDGFADKLGTLLHFGQSVTLKARVDDFKTPSHWHDYKYDENLGDYNLIGDGATLTAHGRRLPCVEFALGLDNPDDLLALSDGDPMKFIAPSIWYGEALWRVGFTVPYAGKKEDTLTWQYCAIDAADNKTCVGPFTVKLEVDPADCGDGQVQAWETCDDDSPTCVLCERTCGNASCDANETLENCPEDCEEAICGNGTCDLPSEDDENCPEDCGPCDYDNACEPPEDAKRCPSECDYDGFCGDGFCDAPYESGLTCTGDCPPEPTGEWACGDGVCDQDETKMSCPEDCAVCGDDECSGPVEDAAECPQDCAMCGDGECSPGEGESCEMDCVNDSATTGTGIDISPGCGCRGTGPDGAVPVAAGLLFLRRRRRRRA
ncbi:FG-GAP repeat domain-containing protein [Nannocystis radixulma]|uniref:VCBS repeat-containing protein n=1 Tax=Nannocystis radixulma TaxID=2995305 RepID=A0ABT5BH18_9BACT|nr:VCBS repeat-containing protein [Nannocystis radixulma]MDC0673436.1 VCBS repeat-containing protein [Nannocystis radixulma]